MSRVPRQPAELIVLDGNFMRTLLRSQGYSERFTGRFVTTRVTMNLLTDNLNAAQTMPIIERTALAGQNPVLMTGKTGKLFGARSA